MRYPIATIDPLVGYYLSVLLFLFFLNDTATPEIYTLSLHDALPISPPRQVDCRLPLSPAALLDRRHRSEEHTSELQSHVNLVCRLLLEKKKTSTSATTAGTMTSTTDTTLYNRPTQSDQLSSLYSTAA